MRDRERRRLPGRVSSEREQPRAPRYEPGAPYLPWIVGLGAAVVMLALALAWVDSTWLNDLDDRRATGWTGVPPSRATLDEIAQFARAQGEQCGSVEEIATLAQGCSSVLTFTARVNDHDTAWGALFAMVFIGLLALSVLFLAFTHRVSANLRHLGIEGQRFTPGWSIGWFLVPVANIVQPWRVYRELWLGSHAPAGSAGTNGPDSWQNVPSPGLVNAWWMSVLGALVFSPWGIALAVGDGGIDAAIQTARLQIWSDLVLAAPAILTMVLVVKVSRAQTVRARAMGVERGPVAAGPPHGR
jgi:hypothetical protein